MSINGDSMHQRFDLMNLEDMLDRCEPERCPHGKLEDELCEECGDLPYDPEIDR